MVSIYIMFFILWGWHACVADLDIIMGGIVLSWTTSIRACDWEYLSLLDGLNCVLCSYFGIEDTPKLETKEWKSK